MTPPADGIRGVPRKGTRGGGTPPSDAASAAFRRDPLAYLTREFAQAPDDVWRSAPGPVCVAGGEAAREVMANAQGHFADTSDFFHTREGVFGPRAAQLEIGRAGRKLMRRHLAAHRDRLPHLVRTRLTPVSSWPDAGNLLVAEHLRELLLAPEAPPALRDTIRDVITRAVLAGARERQTPPARLLLRRRVRRTLTREIRVRREALRRKGAPGVPRDLLDVVVAHGGSDAPPDELAEVYLSFVFATVGSIGFALGWCVYLTATHPGTADEEPGYIVREALRLWPVAWLFARTPEQAHELSGVPVGPGDEVAVCSYLVHHNPRHWPRPDSFEPGRWARPAPEAAYLPFGLGPHSCAGAGVTLHLLEDLVRLIVHELRPEVVPSGGAPHLGPALAPPRFTAEPRGHVRTDPPERR